MSDALYLPFDTETGGLTTESSLLTAHFAVCDKELNILDELELYTRPNDRYYTVSAEALTVNKIDLIDHDKIALTYSEAGQELREFLWKYSKNGKIKLIPVGKNVPFDVKKVNETLLGEKTWRQLVSYRQYDITSVVIFLKRKGLLPEDAPESLEGLANMMGFKYESHTAQGDTYAAIAVIKWLEALGVPANAKL
jgi:hypothetical protein